MTDTDQTREQLIEEVAALRARVAELEGLVSKEFVSNLTFELRYPLSSIRLNEALLERLGDQQNPEKRDKYHATLKRELWRLEMAIEKTLYWMQLQTVSEPQPRLQAVDLNAIVDSRNTDLQMFAESKEVLLTFAPQSDLPPAYSNESLLSYDVMCMILTNAVMFTPQGGEVTITTGTQDADDQQWVGFTVSDTGPGIPQNEQPHIFEPYFRGEAIHKTFPRGTGLGLAIARRMIDLLQGRIELTSSGVPGEGTTVSVWLPVADE